MIKRKILFGDYDTASDGLLTLTGWTLTAPVYKSNFVAVPGRDGDLDLTTALTDGEPRYSNRTLTATFESSEGTRLDRQEIFDDLLARLDGRRANIVLPDYEDFYLDGRAHVAISYNDPVHGALTVTANCLPWRFAVNETVQTLNASSTARKVILRNYGRRVVIPTVTVAGSASLSFGSRTWSLSDGTYTLPELALRPGANTISYSGSGTVTIRYREAIL